MARITQISDAAATPDLVLRAGPVRGAHGEHARDGGAVASDLHRTFAQLPRVETARPVDAQAAVIVDAGDDHADLVGVGRQANQGAVTGEAHEHIARGVGLGCVAPRGQLVAHDLGHAPFMARHRGRIQQRRQQRQRRMVSVCGQFCAEK